MDTCVRAKKEGEHTMNWWKKLRATMKQALWPGDKSDDGHQTSRALTRRYISPQDLADAHHVTRRTIYRWLAVGEVPFIKVSNGRVRIPRYVLYWQVGRTKKKGGKYGRSRMGSRV